LPHDTYVPAMPGPAIQIFPLHGLPQIGGASDLGALIADARGASDIALAKGDVLVVAQKIVSKAEGRVVRLDSVTPSERAVHWARDWGKDSRLIELVLSEAKSILRMERGVIIAETRHGFVCANAGVDVSNTEDGTAVLLPVDPDASARRIRDALRDRYGVDLAVIVSDSFGRAWREGLVNAALGVAGMEALRDERGLPDMYGRKLEATIIAVADEIAAAAGLVMGKAEGTPVALARGVLRKKTEGSGRDLLRPKERDLFR
jgi:coenzyme F420-0:L-glutamate ligase/coenzyme F420-1:gamma-L-glutamate ligase